MQRCSPGKRETNHTRSRLMAQRVKLPTKLLRRELHVAPWELFSEVPHWMSSMMLQMSQKLGLKPICLRKMRLLCHGGLLLGTCPEILIGRCLVKQLQGISHYYLQQGQSKVRFCRANVPEKSRTASTASRYSGCLIIQEKHKDFPKKKWSHNFCPKNCSVIVPSTDDLGLEASCHGAKAFPARAANDCCQLPPHDVPCDTALPKKKKAKDPAAYVGTSNLSGEVNVYNTCNLLSGGRLMGLLTLQRGCNDPTWFNGKQHLTGRFLDKESMILWNEPSQPSFFVVLQINGFSCLYNK